LSKTPFMADQFLVPVCTIFMDRTKGFTSKRRLGFFDHESPRSSYSCLFTIVQ
jgi:hypothetical protein